MTIVDTENFTSNAPPIYSYVFSFEENFSPTRARQWMKENYSNGYLFVSIYVFLIFSIQFYMRNKPRYDLRRALTLWNAGLAIFSIMGALRTVPELYHMLSDHSLYHSVCYPVVLEPTKVAEFWTWLFALSKLAELGDTMFVVLRKNPLIFLHWYHHVTVLLYIWFAYADNSSYVRWFLAMNYSIHSCMYSYYALRALGFSVPKFIMISITFSQVIQMVIGCTVIALAYYYRLTDQPCQITNWNMVLSWCMYFSYLILFSRLFYKMYIKPPKKQHSSVPNDIKIKGK